MYEYSRPVYYYETDKMGVVHHSNYVRWMEESRTFFFNDNNIAYVETERLGVMCPITDINVKYRRPARYGDSFTVRLELIQYTGVRFRMSYTAVNQDGELLIEGESGHAFIGADYRPISLARAIPERHEVMQALVEE